MACREGREEGFTDYQSVRNLLALLPAVELLQFSTSPPPEPRAPFTAINEVLQTYDLSLLFAEPYYSWAFVCKLQGMLGHFNGIDLATTF
jgi:hypothetical protein